MDPKVAAALGINPGHLEVPADVALAVGLDPLGYDKQRHAETPAWARRNVRESRRREANLPVPKTP